ncbi:hypothetical protein ACFC89_06415 [Enterococcus casseliflavus]|uniref:hypothetical protein n=1 Tax=Enterococcus casseliflavus TaxID=37734 RepID=UPI0039A6E361
MVSGLKEGLINGFSEVKSDVSTWANELQKGIESEFDSNYFNDLVANIPSKIPAMDALINGRLAPELASGVSKANAIDPANQTIKNIFNKQDTQNSTPDYIVLKNTIETNGKAWAEQTAVFTKEELDQQSYIQRVARRYE